MYTSSYGPSTNLDGFRPRVDTREMTRTARLPPKSLLGTYGTTTSSKLWSARDICYY